MIAAIATQELRRLFLSPLAWIALAVAQFLLAIFFFLLLHQFGTTPYYGNLGVTAVVAAGTLQIAGLVLLLLAPFITMRLISEERRSGSLRLLLSSPVSITEIVLGKYLGCLGFFLACVLLTALMPLSLLAGTTLDLGQLLAALLGLVLLLAAFAAIGLFVSALTDQPAVAAISTFGVLFLLWIINLAGGAANEKTAALFAYLSLLKHYDALLAGIFNSVDVIYYLLVGATFVVLTIWRLDGERLHG